jgi:hypothetical protein
MKRMFVVYYETILSELKIKPSTRFFLLFIMNRERELKIRLMNEGRWDERLQDRVEEST